MNGLTYRVRYSKWNNIWDRFLDWRERHEWLVFIIFMAWEIFWITSFFCYPAYVSYSDSIGKEAFLSNYLMEKNPSGYYVPSSDTIVLLKNSTFVLRHELCHRAYSITHVNSTSDSFSQELECYIKEWFFWRKVNLTTLDYEKKQIR